MMYDVAIVLLNYNGVHWLLRFLPTLVKYSSQTPIYLIDNASTDESHAFLATYFSNILVISLPKNKGYAGGYNEGLAQIKAKYYVLLNTDVEVTQHWMDPVLSFMEKSPKVAACQPKIRNYLRRTYFDYAGAAGGLIDRLGYPFCRGRVFYTLEQDKGQYDTKPYRCTWASGACLFIRAQAFWKVGGFDEAFYMHMEEIDLCWRLHTYGYSIYSCTDSLVYHVGGGSLHVDHFQKTFYNYRNNLYMLYKNLSFIYYIKLFMLRSLLDMLATLQFILKGKFLHALSVIRAYVACWLLIFKTKRLAKSTVMPPMSLILLPFRYFVKGQRTYLSLRKG